MEIDSIQDLIYEPGELTLDDISCNANIARTLHNQIRLDPKIRELFPTAVNLLPIHNRFVLLYGPPASGKTHLCRALANSFAKLYPENASSIFWITTLSISSKYIGEGAQRIDAVAQAAKRAERALIILDALEEFCPRRDSDATTIPNYTNSILRLWEKTRDLDVTIVATTHRPWRVDPAVLSRMSPKIFVDYPTAEEAEAYLSERCELGALLGDAPEESRRLVALAASLAAQKHLPYRALNLLYTNLSYKSAERTMEACPDKGAAPLPLIEADVRQAVDSIAPYLSEEEYQRYLSSQHSL